MTFGLCLLLVFFIFWVLFYTTGPALEHLLGRLAHRVAKFRYRDYLPAVLVVLAGLAIALAAGNLFEDLAEAVQEKSPRLEAFDRSVHDWARYAHTDGSTRLFVALTIIGTPPEMAALVILVVIVLSIRRRWRWAAYLAFTSGVGALLNQALKAFFARARPDLAEALRRAHGYSFPSGHSMGATIVFLALGYLAFRSLHGWRERAAALAFACTMALAIAASRIYLGVHWISDVAAGIAAGLIWVATTTVAYETTRRIRRVRHLRQTTSSDRTSLGA